MNLIPGPVIAAALLVISVLLEPYMSMSLVVYMQFNPLDLLLLISVI